MWGAYKKRSHVLCSSIDVHNTLTLKRGLGHQEECQDELKHECSSHGVEADLVRAVLYDWASCEHVSPRQWG